MANAMTRTLKTFLFWRLFMLAFAPALLLAGCGGGEELRHDGKTLNEWVADAKGRDAKVRIAAYEALVHFRGNKTATETLREKMMSDSAPVGERFVAARCLFRLTGEEGEVIDGTRAVIRREADSSTGLRATKELTDLFFWLGARSKPLIPDLQYARGRIRGQDPASAQRRAAIDQVIGDIQ